MTPSARLKRLLQKVGRLQSTLTGVSPKAVVALTELPKFLRDLRTYRSGAQAGAFPAQLRHLFPILTDYRDHAGSTRGHYFHQDLWVARQIFGRAPAKHIDIGSRIDGFVSHLLTFMPVTVIDVRPLPSTVKGLTFVQADSMSESSLTDEKVDSLSSLHAIEHFGLGRYGDPIDVDGWRKGISTLKKLIAPGGTVYFSVPIGRERVEFNAHRVFNPQTIISEFLPFELETFVAVDDEGNLNENCSPNEFSDAFYSCGIFVFRSPRPGDLKV